MERKYLNNTYQANDVRGVKLIPILILFGVFLISTLVFLVLTTDNFDFLERPYMLPWIIAVGIVLITPSAYLLYKNKFTIYHPLVYPAVFYFIPSFFIGGIILMLGINTPYFLSFIQDQEYNLPLTMIVIIIGFIGLTTGFFIPFGKRIGQSVSYYLPTWEWDDEYVILPGIVILILGFINQIIGFFVGVIGFQRIDVASRFDGIVFITTLLWLQGSFMLWVAVFRRNKLDFKAVMVVGLILATSLLKAVFAGNRGSLFQVFTVVLMSYIFAGKIVKAKQAAVLATGLVLVILIGMIYGTTFRQVKGSEDRVETSKYVNDISRTFDSIGDADLLSVLGQGFSHLSERLEAVSSLAVVVSNYEQLKPYEESYGIDNNIYKDTVTFIVPRIFWKDKPVGSDPRKYSELYFNYGENSFAITPVGDLLRNFGMIGVPIGMLILGFIVRILYAMLVEDQPFSYWRSILYFMIVPSISYENFYGAIIPYLIKAGFITIIGILLTQFLINKTDYRNHRK